MRSYFFKFFINYKKNKFFEYLKLKYLILNIYFSNIQKLNYKNKLKLFCIESGKTKSVDFFFLLFRMDLKKFFSIGFLNGIKKIS